MNSPARDGPTGDLIEEYLDRLLVSLPGSPRQIRHTLSEVEAHLREAVAEGMAAGPARLGSVMTNRVWPGRLVTPTLPPCAAVTASTIASPSPVPPISRDRAVSTR